VTCPPEWTCALYVDGELSAAEAHQVEAHLVGCQRCRAQVLALRDEARLLGDVLHERERAAFAAAPRAAPARGLALGAIPTLGLAALALAAIGVLLEARVLSAVEAPGLLEFAVAVGATASIAALLTFLVTALGQRLLRRAAVLVAGVLAGSVALSDASALELRFHEGSVQVRRGETVEGTLIVSSDVLNVDGVIDGDLFVLAERVTVRGEIRGDLFALTHNLSVSGDVHGSLHTGNDRTQLAGNVRRNLYALTGEFELSKSGRVGRDATLIGGDESSYSIDGDVGRDLFAGDVTGLAEFVELRGSVGRNVRTRARRVALFDTARVGGDLEATLYPDAEIDLAPGAVVSGETRKSTADDLISELTENPWSHYGNPAFYLVSGILVTGALLVGALLHVLLPGIYSGRLETGADFLRALGIGFLGLIVTPFAIFVIGATLVGLPLALIFGALYLIALYLSMILIAALIGTALLQPHAETTGAFSLSLLVGLLILFVAGSLPFLGPLVHVLAGLTGLGLLAGQVRMAWRAA
jgi:cytoskeletal protein CcmA (bactofilin family)